MIADIYYLQKLPKHFTDIVSSNIQETLGYRCYYYFHFTGWKKINKLGKMAQLIVADPELKAIWFYNPLSNCHPKRCQERALENAYSSGYSLGTKNKERVRN